MTDDKESPGGGGEGPKKEYHFHPDPVRDAEMMAALSESIARFRQQVETIARLAAESVVRNVLRERAERETRSNESDDSSAPETKSPQRPAESDEP